MKRFALIGSAGYIAPKHMKAIKDCGGELVATLDKSDSVGIIDSYFPKANFFTEFERFDRFLDKQKRKGEKIDYLVVCTPNYLHDAHIRFGLRYGCDVICEKPLVLNPWNVDALTEIEKETNHRVWNILQLRVHPSIIALKKQIEKGDKNKIYDIDLTYLTARGNWYYSSWKGDIEKSGGIATNIGIHFYDMLTWIFGEVEKNIVHLHTHDRAAGLLQLKQARVRWFLSINEELLPNKVKEKGLRTYRSIELEGKEIEFSTGFTDLHSICYENILKGGGFGLSDTRQSIEIVHDIRNAKVIKLMGNEHPLAKESLSKHPFY